MSVDPASRVSSSLMENNMSSSKQLVPYESDEVVIYMDDVSGANVKIQPIRTHGLGKWLTGNATNSPSNNTSRGRAAPLMETDNNPERNRPPARGPEIDDLEPGTRRRENGNDGDDRGIDDGLLPSDRGLRPGRFDVNIYQQKKTLAQGMMDLALISANANQLRYILQSHGHPFYFVSLAMISTSLILQIVVGIGLIWNSTYNVKKHKQVFKANKANNWTVIGIFLVTILNVFVSSFGVAEPLLTIPLKGSEIEALKESLRIN